MRIYVSSTSMDLADKYRPAVIQAVQRLGHQAVNMENYVADAQTPVDKCLADVVSCDLYLGVFAWRYGYVPADPRYEGRSVTELEYRQARAQGIPTLIFLLHEDAPWPRPLMDQGEAAVCVERLRAELMKEHVASFFHGPSDLAASATAAIANAHELTKRGPANPPASALPAPEDFKAFLEKKRANFCGRQWVFDDIDQWLNDEHVFAALLVTGDPGAGKSALLSEWGERNLHRILACHCCEALMNDLLRPGRFVLNIAAQVAQRMPEYARLVAEDQGLERWRSEESCENDPIQAFRSLVLERLRMLCPPDGTVRVLLVDALDEAAALKDSNSTTIIDVLATTVEWFPDWLRLIATSRPEKDILKKFSLRNELPLVAKDERNLDDLAMYIAARLKEPKLAECLLRSKLTAYDVRQTLTEKSAGNFLYVQQTLDGVKCGAFQFAQLDQMPPGLNNLYLRWFRWQFPDEAAYAPVRQLLEVVVAAYEPLSKSQLAEVTGLDADEQIPPVLARLSAYIPERAGAYKLYHQSLGEWLTSSELAEDTRTPRYYVNRKRGHRRLADWGWQLYCKSSTRLPAYFQRYLPDHLIQTARWDDLALFLADLGLLEQIRNLGRAFVWMQHWQRLGKEGAYDPAQAYTEQLQTVIDREGESERVSELADLIGCFLRDMGDNLPALPFMERGLRLSEQSYGKEHPETATRMHNLGELYRLTEQHDKALPLLQEALRIREMLAVDDRDLAASYHKLGEFLHDVGEASLDNAYHFEALKYYEESLAIHNRTFVENDSTRGDCIHDIGVVHMQLGERAEAAGQRTHAEQFFNKALAQFDQAKAIFDACFGAENPESATADLNTSTIYRSLGNVAEAVDLACHALAQLRKTLSEHHYKIRVALSLVADLQRRCGRWQESIANLADELRLTRETLGPAAAEHALVKLAATCAASGNVDQGLAELRSYGKILRSQDKPRLAELYLEVARLCQAWEIFGQSNSFVEEGLKLQEEAFGPQSLKLADTVLLLARFSEASGRHDLAERAYQRLLQLCDGVSETDRATVLSIFGLVKEFYDKRLRHTEAAALGERIVSTSEETPGITEVKRATSLNNLGFSYVRIGRFAEARDRCIQALDLYKQAGASDCSATLNNLAEAHLGLGNLNDAQECCSQALAFREKAGNSKRLAICQTTWAALLAARADFDGADVSFQASLENHDRAGASPCPFRVEALERYAAFLRDRGREQETQAIDTRAKSERKLLTGDASGPVIPLAKSVGT